MDLCTTYVEALQAEPFSLSITAPCPVCEVLVGRHAHVPSVLPSPAPVRSSAGSASGANANAFSRLASLLDKWTSKSVCRPFLQRMKQLLSTSDIDPAHWPKLLMYVVTDVASAQWIADEIIDKGLSWDEAETAFTTHFQLSDYTESLWHEWDACRQRPGESVQSFSERYSELLHQLGLGKDDLLVRKKFVNALSKHIFIDYNRHITSKKLDDSRFILSTLSRIIEVCTAIDVAQRTEAAHHRSNATASAGYGGSTLLSGAVHGGAAVAGEKRAGPLHCSFHPSSTNHTTAECRTSTSGTATASSPVHTRTPIICHACGEPGHISPNCPNKRSGHAPTAAASFPGVRPSTGVPSSSSSPSVFAPPVGASSSPASASSVPAAVELRRSTREPAPRQLWTPSARAAEVTHAESDYYVHDARLQVQDTSPHCNVLSVLSCGSADAHTPMPAADAHAHGAPVQLRLQLLIAGRVFDCLTDTGANCSYADAGVVHELGLPVQAVSGQIRLAQQGVTAARLGVTHPCCVTAFVPVPSVKFPAQTFSLSFEVMSLCTSEYQIILGRDVLPLLFPAGLPSTFWSASHTLRPYSVHTAWPAHSNTEHKQSSLHPPAAPSHASLSTPLPVPAADMPSRAVVPVTVPAPPFLNQTLSPTL
jgi:hypothetical protein